MNGMILAAGEGRRMEPLSSFIAKPALEVLGKPLLASAFEHLRRYGCAPIAVNCHRHPGQVEAAVCSIAPIGSYVLSPEAELLGPAGGIAAAFPRFGAGAVLAANGDVWATLDLSALLAAGGDGCSVLALIPHPDPSRWGSVGLAQDGAVTGIHPPCAPPPSPLLFTGFQLLGSDIVAALPRPPAQMGPVWRQLMARGALRGVIVAGEWREAGDPASYRRLVTDLAGAEGWNHEQADVSPHAATPASAVGRGCRVRGGATVAETVLTGGCTVGRCRLERCVVAGSVELPDGFAATDRLILPSGDFALADRESQR